MDIQTAEAHLEEWMTALQYASSGSTYSIDGRSLTRQDITEIRAEIQRWHNTVATLKARAAGHSRGLGPTASFQRPGSGIGSGVYPDSVWRDGRG